MIFMDAWCHLNGRHKNQCITFNQTTDHHDDHHDDGNVCRLDFDQQVLIRPYSMNMTHILTLDLWKGFSFQDLWKIFPYKAGVIFLED